jgi:hypothetical protein
MWLWESHFVLTLGVLLHEAPRSIQCLRLTVVAGRHVCGRPRILELVGFPIGGCVLGSYGSPKHLNTKWSRCCF